MHAPTLETDRLLLRPWSDADLVPFAAMNADPRVMEFFPDRLTRAQSDDLAARIRKSMAEQGWGLWAVEVIGGNPFIGFTGLAVPTFEAHFTPCVEIGWRLASGHWGHGYATEAARAVLDFAFVAIELDEVVALTTTSNLRSMRVMEKLGMTRDPSDDFDHPKLAVDDPLRPHVCYRVAAPTRA